MEAKIKEDIFDNYVVKKIQERKQEIWKSVLFEYLCARIKI